MLPVVESIDVSQREDLHKLRGRSVGLMGVLFLTVTGAAPISAMLFNTPIAVGFGNGIGAPAGFLVATIVLTVFSVGYVAMSRKVTAAGGFYSFISHGLNRELGMASGFAMVAAYSVFEVSLVGGFAYFASLKAAHYGWHVQWYWCGLFMIAVICVGIFYTITSWAGVSGYHSIDSAAVVAQNDSANFFFLPAHHYAGYFLQDCLSWFIITGSFACGMAFHNTTARYMYSLGRERVLPPALGRTHPRFHSPHIASTTQSVIAALIMGAFALFASVDHTTGAAQSVGYIQVYGLMAVMGVVSILAIQAIVSIAIVNYFRTHHKEDHHWWTTPTAPPASAPAQASGADLRTQEPKC